MWLESTLLVRSGTSVSLRINDLRSSHKLLKWSHILIVMILFVIVEASIPQTVGLSNSLCLRCNAAKMALSAYNSSQRTKRLGVADPSHADKRLWVS